VPGSDRDVGNGRALYFALTRARYRVGMVALGDSRKMLELADYQYIRGLGFSLKYSYGPFSNTRFKRRSSRLLSRTGGSTTLT